MHHLPCARAGQRRAAARGTDTATRAKATIHVNMADGVAQRQGQSDNVALRLIANGITHRTHGGRKVRNNLAMNGGVVYPSIPTPHFFLVPRDSP